MRIAHQPDAARRQFGESIRGRQDAHAGPQPGFRKYRYRETRQHGGADRGRVAARIQHAIGASERVEAFDRGASGFSTGRTDNHRSRDGRSTPAARQITVALIERWQREIVDGIRSMQRSGRVSPDLDPDDVGRALLAGIQGGVSIMLATGDSAHLESALDVGIAGLRRR